MSVREYAPIYSVKEVAKILQVSINTTYDLLNSGRLPYLVLGAKKVRGSDLEAFIQNYPVADENERGDGKHDAGGNE